MRIVFLGLLLANLVLFAWSQWLAPEAPATVAPSVAAAATAGGAAATPMRILLASERLAAGVPGSPTAGAMPMVAASASGTAIDPAAIPDRAADGMADATAGAAAAASVDGAGGRCMSMGPFTDLETTARATSMLNQEGYQPRQRPANGAVPDGFMVAIGGLKSEPDQARVVRRLSRGGLDDAFAMPKLDDGYAVSVGLFSERRRAERRVLAVERMGFKAEIVDRTRAGTVYWIDFDLKTPAGEAGAEDPLMKTADPSQKWQLTPCPEPGAVG